MNAALENRWQRGLPPFDGPALVADEEALTDSTLLVIVRLALAILRDSHGSNALYVNEDWHDHDGFVMPERAASWLEAASWTQDVQALRVSCSDDWRVHTLLFPDDFTFSLRYWLDGEGECSFDLSAERGVLEKLASTLHEGGIAFRIESSAKDHFNRRWGG